MTVERAAAIVSRKELAENDFSCCETAEYCVLVLRPAAESAERRCASVETY